MQPALDVRSAAQAAVARPVIATGSGDRGPVRAVSSVTAFNRGLDLPDERLRSENRRPGGDYETPSRVVALVRAPLQEPSAPSSLFMAQRIAQGDFGDSETVETDEEASIAAYREASERGTIFYGLEYPVDFSV